MRDNGIGIDPELLPRVFDLFTQAERSLDRSQGGLGIGLTLVRRLVEMHGGSVTASSAGIGQGSEFVVRLPGLDVAVAEEPEPGLEASKVKGRSLRILVVDDNIQSADSLARIVRLWGHDTCMANTGMEALEIAQTFRPTSCCWTSASPEWMATPSLVACKRLPP